MIYPAIQRVRDMPEDVKHCFRKIFRGLIVSGFVKQDLGLEATEECLESFYDTGRIKISAEPSGHADMIGRILLYDEKKGGYFVIEKLEIKSKC